MDSLQPLKTEGSGFSGKGTCEPRTRIGGDGVEKPMQIRLEMSFQEKLPRILDPQQNNKKNSRKLLYPCSFTSRNIKNKGFLGGYIFNIW